MLWARRRASPRRSPGGGRGDRRADRPGGRIQVEPDLTIPGHPEIFVVGDAAVQPWKPERADAGRRPGRDPGRDVRARRRSGAGSSAGRREPFRYRNQGDVAVIGRLAGVTNIPWLGPFGQQGGFLAWVLWLVIHIVYLIGFANRIVVLTPLGLELPDPRPRLAPDHRAAAAAADRGAGAAGIAPPTDGAGAGGGRRRAPTGSGPPRPDPQRPQSKSIDLTRTPSPRRIAVERVLELVEPDPRGDEPLDRQPAREVTSAA